MAQLSDIKSSKSLSGIPADYQPVCRPAEFVAEVFPPAPYCSHGEVLNVQQAWLDLVSLIFSLLMNDHFITFLCYDKLYLLKFLDSC